MARPAFRPVGAAHAAGHASGNECFRNDRRGNPSNSPLYSLVTAGLEALDWQELRGLVEQPLGCSGRLRLEATGARRSKQNRASDMIPIRS